MISVIPLCKEHIDGICEIEAESFGDPWSRQIFLDLIENPITIAFAAVERGALEVPKINGSNIAGYLITYRIGSEIQILNIAVKKSERNKKIATKLFGVILDYAKSKKIGEFTLEVRQSNTAAAALYKKLGFKTDGVRKNYYTNPKEDAILMSLKL